ncbi:MAG: 50S ribosomal protein L19e [Thermoprotei archaeon]|nr:MAG: 50S ribosomal protein L19e [Thermoprotei archaeon]
MTDLSLQKRLAAEVAGVGVSRVRIDPTRIEDVEAALRREDIRRLIKDGAIWIEPKRRNSRGRWKDLHRKRKKGHRRGPGRRKGAKGARTDEKKKWVYTIRKIRRYLKWLRDHEVIDRKTYRKLYLLAKGGTFRSLADLKRHLMDMGIQVR